MYVCSIWFDFESHSLLHEKIIYERMTDHMFNKPVLYSFVSSVSDFVRLRWSFSISTDWSMLFYAIVSILPYLSKSDTVSCRRYNYNFSLLVDISLARSILSNIQFHLLFYLSTFTYDIDTDVDCVYQLWTHGRSGFHTNQNVLHFRRRSIAFDDAYNAYFFSKFDANLWYYISVEIALRHRNNIIASLTGSLYYLSLVNTNIKHSLILLNG